MTSEQAKLYGPKIAELIQAHADGELQALRGDGWVTVTSPTAAEIADDVACNRGNFRRRPKPRVIWVNEVDGNVIGRTAQSHPKYAAHDVIGVPNSRQVKFVEAINDNE